MRTNKTRLGVEWLDERDVPACLVALGGPDTLVITGNAASDAVVINDNGAGGITGSATGWGTFSFAGIKNIKVDTSAGNDRVVYNLIRNLLPGQERTVDVRTNVGTDSFTANLFNPRTGVGSDLMQNSRLVIAGFGGDGNDVMRINAHHDVDVAQGAALKMILLGEGGNDLMTAYFRGENDGAVSLRELDGGIGNDSIRGVIREDLGSTGISAGQVHGSDGDDTLGLYLWTLNPPILGVLDGGLGMDTANFTPNVTVTNVP